MAIHAVVALLVKRPVLNLLPRLLPVLWPFNLCLPLARNLPRMCRVFQRTSALLLFRLDHVIGAGVPRFRRAIQLILDEIGASRGTLGSHHPNVLDDSTISSLLSVAI